MLPIESLKDYLGVTRKAEFMALAKQIGQVLAVVSADYPHSQDWYWQKQLAGISTPERNILFARDPQQTNEIVALACLKKTDKERKICTLYVDEKMRGNGVGSVLVVKSLAWLGTTKPLITFAENKLPMFLPFAQKYGWHIKARLQGIYEPQSCELCFNGTLIKEQNKQKEQTVGSSSATATAATHKLSTLVGSRKQQDHTVDLTK